MLFLTGTDLVNALVLLSGIIMLPTNLYIVYAVAKGDSIELRIIFILLIIHIIIIIHTGSLHLIFDFPAPTLMYCAVDCVHASFG